MAVGNGRAYNCDADEKLPALENFNETAVFYQGILTRAKKYFDTSVDVLIQVLTIRIKLSLPLFSTVLPSNGCCFCPVGLSLL